MRRVTQQQRSITRRAFFLGGLQLAFTSTLVARLYYLQFIKAETYSTLAEDNRINLQLMAPLRGKILDHRGKPLAENKLYYQVLLTKGEKLQTQKTLGTLTKLLELPDITLRRIDQELRGLPQGRTVLVKEYLTWDEVSKIEFYIPELPGAAIAEAFMRHYPMEEKASHLVGYVGAVSPDEKDQQPLYHVPGFKVGKSGMEKMLEDQIRGAPGVRHLEMNAHGVPIREVKRDDPKPGKDIQTTIDRRLQRFATERYKEESGAAIVIHVNTGEIRALVSTPAFDPNSFSRGITSVYWKELNANEKNPLLNKAITGQYPPGSTFKCMMAAAALQEGAANAYTSVYCPGHFYLGNHRFNCWKPEGHGNVTVIDALAESCDTFFYTMARKMGINTMAKYGRMFGFGDRTGIGLLGEKTGIMPSEEWKEQTYAQKWQPGDTISCGIGQGYVISTPLQLAVMTARLASGKMVSPRLQPLEKDTEIPALDISQDALKLVREGMIETVNTGRGTAYGSRITDEGFSMAGKTGTSQVRKIVVRGLNQNLLPWNQRHHALFVGFGPIDVPEYAIAVLVEHGGGGASAAAPVAKDILLKTMQFAKEDA
ncbi:MAG: penicillin-binding protein 2 [Rickettsiales bacterium]